MTRLLYISRSVARCFGVAIGAMLVVVLLCDRARPDDGLTYGAGDYDQHPEAAELWRGWSDPFQLFWTTSPAAKSWTIDYRIQQMFNSRTSYQLAPRRSWAVPNMLRLASSTGL